jgi:hypothetical protein
VSFRIGVTDKYLCFLAISLNCPAAAVSPIADSIPQGWVGVKGRGF